MPICLSIQNYSWRQALITHSLREGLMIRAFVVNFVAELRKWNTILAFLVRLMLTLTFCLNITKICFKTLVLDKLIIFITCNTIRAFLKWAMIASAFDIFDTVLSNSKAI
jgi:hypothetical protein